MRILIFTHILRHLPAAAATPDNNAEAGGAMSKPLILLLHIY